MAREPDRFNPAALLDQAMLLLYRLERISADSAWAHRSSGLRGELLRLLDGLEKDSLQASPNPPPPGGEWERLERLVSAGYAMLASAAREMVR